MAQPASQTGYAPVNGLQMYYEIHGVGRPTLLLHGAYGATGLWGDLLPGLAAGRQIIAVDLQGHGRTADIDRPIRYEPMADDCAALLDHLGIEQADVVAYSLGAATGLRLAMRHPGRVRRQALASASFRSDGIYQEILDQIHTITPEVFAGTPYEEGYKAVASRPEDFPRLVEKLKDLDAQPFDWTADMPSVQAPTLTIIGDADIVKPEHAVEMLRALGGGITGAMLDGSPKSQLAILPNTAHQGVPMRTELLLAVIHPFLDAPESEADGATPAVASS
jgi:pimeloyl-ACP methyl ester carboxylesterase